MNNKGSMPSVKDLVELCEPSDPQISPDGRMIAYLQRRVDWEQNRYQDDLWVINRAAPTPLRRQLLKESAGIWSYRWSPDGHWLAFGSHRPEEEHPTLELLNPHTGEQHTLCTLLTGGYGFNWSSDSQHIAYMAKGQPRETEESQKKDRANAYVMDQRWEKDQLWLVSLENNDPQQITDLAVHITGFDWRPDSSQIVFSAVPTPDENDWDQCHLHLLTVSTGEIKDLTGIGCQKPQFAPDGKTIIYKQLGNPSFIDVSQIGLIDVDGCNPRTLQPFDNETYLLRWQKEGVYLLAIEGVTTHVYRMDPVTGEVEQLTPDDPPGFAIPEGWIGWGCGFTGDGKKMVYIHYDRDHFAEIALLDTQTGQQTILTDHTAKITPWHLPEPELIRWQTEDGLEIEGVLVKPVDFNPDKQVPLVVVAHGGPTHTSMLPPMIDGDWWYGALPQLLHKGAMVLFVNYRGSNGYGAKFQQANVLTLGISELADIISGVDDLVEKGWVNPERVGIVGMSHGGYLAAFAATYSDRFRAAVMLSGISDWSLNYYMTDTREWMQQYLHAAPWENPEAYRKVSPVSYLTRAKTPLLIQHGERDNRAPIANAQAIYRGLRDNGIPVRLVVYPEEGHGIGSPVEFERCIQETFDWFSHWLWK